MWVRRWLLDALCTTALVKAITIAAAASQFAKKRPVFLVAFASDHR
jgi:hypothetical protein